MCENLCGNGVRDGNEECEGGDLGGASCETVEGAYTGGTLKCSARCVFDTTECILPGCGDGILDFGEECDDGNGENDDSCLNNCQSARCGDGYLWRAEEECDDGNTSNGDACLNDCVEAACGDGHLWLSREACDDGNDSNSDGCLNSCESATCGDGYIREGVEECDGGACCTSSCDFAGYSTVCRWSSGDCDVQERCSGSSASCPYDAHLPDGTLCSGGICEGGQCVTCYPTTGEFCNGNDLEVEYNCGCGEPSGDNWVDQGDGCYHRLTGEICTECGDGVVEGDEECEGGLCCDPNCMFYSSVEMCRGASGECDAAEYCTGSSASCPPDEPVADGTPCSDGECVGGQCVCVPGTGTFCNGNDQSTEFNCGCGEPAGDWWIDQGNGCYHRFPSFCNADSVRIMYSCGCGEPTVDVWVDVGGGCYHKNTGQAC